MALACTTNDLPGGGKGRDTPPFHQPEPKIAGVTWSLSICFMREQDPCSSLAPAQASRPVGNRTAIFCRPLVMTSGSPCESHVFMFLRNSLIPTHAAVFMCTPPCRQKSVHPPISSRVHNQRSEEVYTREQLYGAGVDVGGVAGGVPFFATFAAFAAAASLSLVSLSSVRMSRVF